MTTSFSRRDWFRAAGGAVAGAVLAGFAADAVVIEPHALRVTRSAVGEPGGAERLVRIAQLTDLHLQRVGSWEAQIARAIAALQPDLIVITGDSIDHRRHVPLLDAFLALLDDATPKLAILGNWEYYARVNMRELAAAYERHHCRLLVNESVALALGGRELLVTGMDDYVLGHPDLRAALAGAAPSANHLLLAHCPAFRDELARQAAPAGGRAPAYPDCMLAGHTHGGQVAFFGYAPLLPYGSGRYLKGWYDRSGPPMYVSCGLGMTGLPIRFGVPPELACFEWNLRTLPAGSAVQG